MAILGVIPARGGSKSIPLKNIVSLAGRPLLAYTADAVSGSRRLTRTIVSTDDARIRAAAADLGLEAPFLRPAELARDETPMVPVIVHALDWHAKETGEDPEAVVLLQPTSPLRQAQDIDRAVDLFREREADSVVSVVEVPHTFNPESVLALVDGRVEPLASAIGPLRRQEKSRVYARNGPAVLVVRPSLVRSGRLYGERTFATIMGRRSSIDIDDPFDLELAALLLAPRADRGG